MNEDEYLVAVCGPVDAGKSTVIGVLTSGILDNGRGSARLKILKHKHEQESGRTSNISFNPLIYKKENNKVYSSPYIGSRYQNKMVYKFDSKDGCDKKVISFVDLAGHQKYLKTTVYGVTGLFPDYGLVIIGANTGISRLTREHLGILLYLKIPIIIIITKIDMAPKHVYQRLCNRIKKLLQNKTYGKVIYSISASDKRNEELNYYLKNMRGNPDVIPVITISNKNGTNINNLHKLFYNIPSRKKWNSIDMTKTVIYIDSKYNVPGIGLVISGTVKGKSVKVKDKMYIGPENGKFKEVFIRSIHNSVREDVKEIKSGNQGCFALKFTNPKEAIPRKQIRKGFVMIDSIKKWEKNISKSFLGKITILHHSTTIKSGYSPTIHCYQIRQTAKLTLDKDEVLRSGSSCLAKFEFENNHEFLEPNRVFFSRDGNMKAIGTIVSII